MPLTRRDRIQRDYADAVKAAYDKHLRAIDKARKARDNALAALNVGTPKRSAPNGRKRTP